MRTEVEKQRTINQTVTAKHTRSQPRQRKHYRQEELFHIIELILAYGLSRKETAATFQQSKNRADTPGVGVPPPICTNDKDINYRTSHL